MNLGIKKLVKSTIYVALLVLLGMSSLNASPTGPIQKFNWNGIEVVWLQDDRYPTYDIMVYFADGALSDTKIKGSTQATFDLLTAGTRRFARNDINDTLEYYGVGLGSSVTHEHTIFSLSGLNKDLNPTLKMVCHLFSDSVFPANELKKEKRRMTDLLKGMVGKKSALASRAFREISLQSTPFDYPVGGKLKDVKRLFGKHLRSKLDYFNRKVKKRIYLSGRKEILQSKNIFLRECGWSGNGEDQNFVRTNPFKAKEKKGPQIVLVTVPKANQAQVRIGRTLGENEIQDDELNTLAASYLGGGFTSLLMQEIRVKRGLTYGISAFASGQKNYGRLGVFSSTRNEKVEEMVRVIKETLESVSKGNIPDLRLKRAKGLLAGGYPFRFEKNSAYLAQLVQLDHIGRPYDDLYKFPQKIEEFQKGAVSKAVGELFNWEKQVILILGEKKLKKALSKFGKVKVVPYDKFL